MNREKIIIKTSIIGIIGNFILVLGKLFIGALAHSISIITDAINNLSDALSSLITIIGTKLSNKKPDRKHPFGHGRIEFITSSIIGGIILLAGAMAIYESIVTILTNRVSNHNRDSLVVIIIGIVGKLLLGAYFTHKGKKVKSDSLKASGVDAFMDSLLSLGTLLGAILAYVSNIFIEGYIGIIIGIFIIKAGIDVLRESVSKIIGERTDPELVESLINDISHFDGVYGVYDLIINNYGMDRNIASVHIEVDDNMTARKIQILERNISALCYEKYHTVMTVGVYATNTLSDADRIKKEKIIDICKKYKEVIQTHGFFIDNEKKILSLDIIIDFGCKNEEEVFLAIKNEIEDLYRDYQVFLVLDNDFTVSRD